ncbi:MAG: thiamine biosynthesis protein ThiS [Planctomycetia bacterium TMED53]|nr:MAG: thiamine biosynthesis protein ThiS [Planctomycetia bacterium TMED53]
MSNQSNRFEIQLNGEVHQIEAETSVLDLVNSLPINPIAVAVERNKKIVPRSLHAETIIEAGDHIEVVTIVGGG